MGKSTDRSLARYRRRKRVRKKIFGTRDRPRLSLHKSNRYIYAQL
ncbi:50S ribosomal protein L18, partial [Candidatus Aerophobetes bacterium]|nr:50S ribosomal protein L18 [Candidatus Aerophobetes bacterium]